MRNLVRLCCVLAVASLITAASSPAAFRTSARARAVAGIITVNSTADFAADDGQCTLREALNSAANDAPSGASSGECAAGSGDDTININVTGTINLTDMLSTTTNVSIVGPGSGMLTLRSTGTPHRVFFKNVSTVSISGLTMTNGSFPAGPGSGGGLINGSGPMTLTDVVITNNHTPDATAGSPSSGSGGGIYNSGPLTLINCVVSGNSTGNAADSGQSGRGGGIDSGGGSLTLINTVVSGNSTGSGPGGVGPGGGIFSGQSATLTDSTVSGNSTGAGTGTDSIHGGAGGGIYSIGTLTLTGSAVSGNSTGKGGDGAFISGNGGNGGGIYVESGSATLTGSAVSGNKTGDGGHALTGGGQFGGAGGGVFNSGSASLTLTYSAVSDNATGVETTGIHTQGGGISNSGTMNITGSLVSGNTGGDGSGLSTVLGTVKITNSTVSGNVGGNAIRITSSPTTLTNCTIASNPGGGVNVPEGSPGFPNNPPPTLRNTIVALNGADLSGAYNSQGHNLVGNAEGSTGFLASGDQIGSSAAPVDPRLGPLADNGGPTKTHALLKGSPALDAGDNALAKDAGDNALTTDQRGAGFQRFADAADADTAQTVDIGAFEAHPTVEDISDKSMIEDSTFSFNFNVGDEAVGLTSVAATSSDTTLVPNNAANISVSAAGSQRTLSVTPAAGLSGTTTVTVTVTAANGRTASDTFLLTVLPATAISSVSGSGVYAGTATLTAKLTDGGVGGPALPGKSVIFMLNGSPAGSATTDASGVATLTGVPLSGFNAGTFGGVVLAVFPGDAGFATSANVGSLTVDKADTTTAVSSSANPSASGQEVTFTATVTSAGGTPTGAVQFKIDGSNVGSPVALSSGVATFTTSSLTAIGAHAVTAEYGGDANFAASSGGLSGGQSVVPKVSITGGFKAEGNVGSGLELDFAISLSAATSSPVFVTYTTADGTATAPSDYEAETGSVFFSPGETFKTISVKMNGDATYEDTETVFVDLSDPLNAVIGEGRGTGLIINDDPTGGVIEFDQSSYTVSEGDTLSVTVKRTVNTGLAVDVDYATDDGSTPSVVVPCSSVTGLALDRCDYTRALGTLHFAPGETEKTIQILVGDDSYVEGSETAHLRLSNPRGDSALGPNSSAAFNITDDSPESAGNVIDDADDFVRQHYHDFLNREPDAAGLAFWKNQMTNCGNPNLEVCRVNVSAAFFKSIEFQETGYLVERTYKTAYGDATSPNVAGTVPVVRFGEFLSDTQRIGRGVQVGVGDWQTKLVENKNAYVLEFVQRPRFTAEYPSTLSPTQFVDKLNAYTGGVLTQDERDTAVNTLSSDNTTHGRSVILSVVAEKPLLRQREFNRAFVLMEYFGYLRRNPDDAPQPGLNYSGWRFWLDKLEEFQGDFVRAEMVKAFLASDEYRQRFGQ